MVATCFYGFPKILCKIHKYYYSNNSEKTSKAFLKPSKTFLILDPPPTKFGEGHILTFTRRLLREDEKPLSNKAIRIYNVGIGRDDFLASGITGENGSFSIPWTAKKQTPSIATLKLGLNLMATKK
jgi:hypothetical protein